jgi:hypothetical protein
MDSRKSNRALEIIGKLFLDFSKLAFGSLILGAVITHGAEPFVLLMYGTFVVFASAGIGTVLVVRNEVKK